MSSSSPFDFVPVAEPWTLDWAAIDSAFPWVREMKDCPQDPEYHAEGDVWIHTRMVVEELMRLPAWQALETADRASVFVAALLHDVGKPACTKLEDGRWRSRGHSAKGAAMARRILWELDTPFAIRERICGLIRFHQIPYYAFDRPDPRKLLFRISLATRCDWLCLLAEADIRGRICATQQDSLDNVALFSEYCRDENVHGAPRTFASDFSRFEYFQREDRDPGYAAYDDAGEFEVILMSGLPGSGKDTWLARNAPELEVISLDDIRLETGASFTGDQGAVVAEAKERARVLLRKRQPFAFNATNLTYEFRTRWIKLFADYRARVRIVYVEAPAAKLWVQNRDRARSVPEAAIERMIGRWEIPELHEAHRVDYAVVREVA
jgi:putative nucleotidyltransferase with HDIG domain